mmetsp:Transcript_227/g.608  ORF Transcript_227/g.608 Transcript_227/m.608 type:complete len:220 (+) Transcript_227:918-1577(+)
MWCKLHQSRRHLSRSRTKKGLGRIRKAALAPLPHVACRPGCESAHERRKLRTCELLQPRENLPAQLSHQFSMLRPCSAIHFLQQLCDLVRWHRLEAYEYLSSHVFKLLGRLSTLNSTNEGLELVIDLCTWSLAPSTKSPDDLFIRPARHLIHCNSLLGLLNIAMQPLHHLLHRVLILLRPRRLRSARNLEALELSQIGGLRRRWQAWARTWCTGHWQPW